jgi:hypothetical protein
MPPEEGVAIPVPVPRLEVRAATMPPEEGVAIPVPVPRDEGLKSVDDEGVFVGRERENDPIFLARESILTAGRLFSLQSVGRETVLVEID